VDVAAGKLRIFASKPVISMLLQSLNVGGVFADHTCGGIQVAIAAGKGAMAAIQAYRYVKRIKR
jgi:thioredoxin reductase